MLNLNQIPILSGGSLEELMLCLRLQHEVRETYFKFKISENRTESFPVSVTMLGSHGPSEDLWSGMIYPQPDYRDSLNKIKNDLYFFYSVRTRRGVLTDEEGWKFLKKINYLLIGSDMKDVADKLATTESEIRSVLGNFVLELFEQKTSW